MKNTGIKDAIALKKEIKGWRRQKNVDLIAIMNPSWPFLTTLFVNQWLSKESIS